MRSRFIQICQKYSPDCVMNEMATHDSSAAPMDWTIPLSSTFCLMPPGDLPTRKGFFDSLLMGCIPVVCRRLSAHEQWNWNLGLEYALAMTYYVPCEEILQSQNQSNFMDHLIRLHKQNDEVVMKRFVISKYASRLQYRIPEGEYRSTPFSYKLKDDQTIRSPPIDAFDIIVDKLLNEIEDINDMVLHPRDRGDWRGVDEYPKYPLGRYITNLTHGEVPCLVNCK